MRVGPEIAIYAVWYFWLASWIAASAWANRTMKTPTVLRELPYRLITFIGFALLLVTPFRWTGGHLATANLHGWIGYRLWIVTLPALGWALVGTAIIGVAFAWWARLHLGRLWSARITRKVGHRVVDSGPYGIVRHPIYTGLLLAAIATTAETGLARTAFGAVLLILGYWMKARVEERFLRVELGEEAYDSYAKRVPMLVPFAAPRTLRKA